jgi:isoleucyl-tRNA synthetase
MTHGFVVDKDTGKKTSKSDDKKKGKPTDAAHFYNKYGADIVRLWVSSVDWQNEVPFGEDLFKQVAEPYRRLRNTLRILLGNLDGYNGALTLVGSDLPLLDRWILERLHCVTEECLKGYESFEFRKVFNSINQFCTTDLSAIYIDALKDRMYCDAPNSPRRLASQAAMYEIFSSITRLLAPVLAYTADEAWEHAPFTEGSIHLQDFPTANPDHAPGQASKEAERLFQIKAAMQTAIEAKVQAKEFTRNNEAAIELTLPETDAHLLEMLNDRDFATEFFIISELTATQGTELSATARKTELPLCPRCRKHEPVVASGLCQRCEDVVSSQAS